MKKLKSFWKESFTDNKHEFKYKIGKNVASSLSSFVAGVVCASIFWLIAIIFLIK